ncbi:hypothetical protein ABBQ38_009549 [Trebouxia sp. C0009 RCD-2024]
MTFCEPQLVLPETSIVSGSRTQPGSFQAPAQSISLADVLHTVPPLLPAVCSTAMTALLATSSSLRCLVREHVSSIAITIDFDTHNQLPELQSLVNGSWPRLQRLSLTSGCGASFEPLIFRDLCSESWIYLARLDLSIHSLQTKAMSQLVSGTWPALKCLNLSHHKLGTAAIAQLAADWTLEELQLTGNSIKVEAMTQLVQCKWSNLKQLKLDRNSLGADAMAVLAEVRWPLQKLDLGYNDLHETWSMPNLAKGRWPSLTMLVLAGNSIGRPGVAALSQANWPHLESLDLSTCHLAGGDTVDLCRTHWPKLTYLNLANNRLNAAAMVFLVDADWPALRCLSLAGNKMGPIGVKAIRYNYWCNMEDLDLTDIEYEEPRLGMQC